jgi:hypothetical protein
VGICSDLHISGICSDLHISAGAKFGDLTVETGEGSLVMMMAFESLCVDRISHCGEVAIRVSCRQWPELWIGECVLFLGFWKGMNGQRSRKGKEGRKLLTQTVAAVPDCAPNFTRALHANDVVGAEKNRLRKGEGGGYMLGSEGKRE